MSDKYRYQILMTIETFADDTDGFMANMDEIKERIKEQVAGHRTQKRLADTVEFSFVQILNVELRIFAEEAK